MGDAAAHEQALVRFLLRRRRPVARGSATRDRRRGTAPRASRPRSAARLPPCRAGASPSPARRAASACWARTSSSRAPSAPRSPTTSSRRPRCAARPLQRLRVAVRPRACPWRAASSLVVASRDLRHRRRRLCCWSARTAPSMSSWSSRTGPPRACRAVDVDDELVVADLVVAEHAVDQLARGLREARRDAALPSLMRSRSARRPARVREDEVQPLAGASRAPRSARRRRARRARRRARRPILARRDEIEQRLDMSPAEADAQRTALLGDRRSSARLGGLAAERRRDALGRDQAAVEERAPRRARRSAPISISFETRKATVIGFRLPGLPSSGTTL